MNRLLFFISKFVRRKHPNEIDEGLNVVSGISKAKPLFKELIRLAHPDRHPNNKGYYEDLSNRINANRYNYNELLKIREEIRMITNDRE